MAVAWLMGNQKAVNLKLLDLGGLCSFSDFFVLGSATNPTQAQAITEILSRSLRPFGIRPLSIEGSGASDWTLVDLGDVVAHIFLEQARSAYDLERLWSAAKTIEIPADYYYEEAADTAKSDPDPDSYF